MADKAYVVGKTFTVIRRPNDTQANILCDGELFITDIPVAVAQQFCANPHQFNDVFLDAPRLRAIALSRELVWTT